MLKLVLDENISPSLSPLLWDQKVDNFAVRDRGRLRISDHRLFALAREEGRIVTTINTTDFERLARKVDTHPGVICIPSGGTRSMQFDYIMRAVEFARSEHAVLPNITDRFIYVPEGDDTVNAQIVRKELPALRVVTASS